MKRVPGAIAKSGDIVRIIITDLEDKRPAEDYLCTDDDYQKVFRRAGPTYKPLAEESELYE